MIPSTEIKKYLRQRRDDHRWLKDLSRTEIDQLISELRPRPKLSTVKPGLNWKHQRISFYLGVAYPQFSYWIDMGGGKTLLSLELFDYWRLCGTVKKMLVFVISDKAFPTWEAHIAKYKPGMKVCSLEGSSEEKFAKLEGFEEGVVLVTYQGAIAMCTQTVRGKRGKNKWQLDKHLIAGLADGVDMIVMDESTKVGNQTSLNHRLCQRIARNLEYRYALAGRPFGRDPTMLWAQQAIIDSDLESFGEYGMFREAFFSKKKNPFVKSKWAFLWNYRKAMANDLSRLMQHRSITFEENEWGDVPRLKAITAEVRFTPDMREHYIRAVSEFAKAQGNLEESKNVFMRMRQITSGFIGFKDDTSGARVQLEFANNPKKDKLLELLESLPYQRKAVVFYEFTWSAKQIVAELQKRRMQHIWLWSGTKNTRAELKRFFEDEYTFIALIQNKVGAYSLDGLQHVANYLMFYERPVGVIDHAQAIKRVKRSGQKRRVLMYDLAVPKSVDTRIIELHNEGREIMSAVRKNPKLLGGNL